MEILTRPIFHSLLMNRWYYLLRGGVLHHQSSLSLQKTQVIVALLAFCGAASDFRVSQSICREARAAGIEEDLDTVQKNS